LAALEASELGHDVVLFEATEAIMNRASLWNEGKIHLGFLYALDRSLRTATTMIDGAFSFVPNLERLTGSPLPHSAVSEPFTYFVHQDSLVGPPDVASYFSEVDRLVRAKHATGNGSYPGYDGGPTFRRLSRSEIDSLAGDWATAAFETSEISLDRVAVAQQIVDAVETSNIDIRLECRIDRLSGQGHDQRVRDDDGGVHLFDSVVNAAWEDRLRLDATRGITVDRPFSHRYKAAIHCAGLKKSFPSATIIIGPYGDVVSFGDSAYLSWYPVGRIGMSSDLVPPNFEATLADVERRDILERSVKALSDLFPAVRESADDLLQSGNSRVEGGFIFAWGDTDVDEDDSELHLRFDVGVQSDGSYHSVDTGKYTTAPLYAKELSLRLGK
jgi:glycine/D-amino acid oxidase-like deaminating enzyme